MKLFVDINIVLDVLLERRPWAEEGARLLSAIERGRAHGHVAGHTITTAYYLVSRNQDPKKAAATVVDLLRIVDVVAVEASDFREALALGLEDFEDAVQATCALKIGAEAIVTRDVNDFNGQPVPAHPAGAVLAML